MLVSYLIFVGDAKTHLRWCIYLVSRASIRAYGWLISGSSYYRDGLTLVLVFLAFHFSDHVIIIFSRPVFIIMLQNCLFVPHVGCHLSTYTFKTLFLTRPSYRAQIWHACADRDETSSHLKKIDPPHSNRNPFESEAVRPTAGGCGPSAAVDKSAMRSFASLFWEVLLYQRIVTMTKVYIASNNLPMEIIRFHTIYDDFSDI